jgi:hypothetical protein
MTGAMKRRFCTVQLLLTMAAILPQRAARADHSMAQIAACAMYTSNVS